ncbi:MAG: histidinol dehydrogenase [Acidimicrobiia bacterium]|jgi:histidinol dehydrogenase
MTRRRLRIADLAALGDGERATLLRRAAIPDRAIRDGAAAICDDVAARGDVAVGEHAESLGGGFRRVGGAEMAAAADRLPEVVAALEEASANIAVFHRAQLPTDLQVTTVPGIEITRRWQPLRRVGAYVPGGKAAYPSTVLMTVVPARVAGVDEIVVASPAAPDGTVPDAVLAACHVTGVDELWIMGGAQAIAALAYGTETVRPVQKIVGPGNAWVTAAKLAVYGVCDIDLPAGPSEVLVLADHTADPRLVAVDLLCQAEHGPDSPAVLVTTDPDLPGRVEVELDRLLPLLERAAILEQALADHGLAVVAPDREAAIAFADEYAAEHVTIVTEDPDRDAKVVTGAGSVYVGRWSPESAGDYATGANHVLPTGGLAAASGPLSVEDFGSWRQVQRLTRQGLEAIRPVIATLATAEGLTAHRMASELRFETERSRS